MSEARELYEQGLEAFRRGDNERSRELNEQSLAVARRDGDARATVDALIGLARAALRDGDLARVHALAAEARELAPDERSLALPLHLDAEATRMSGDLAAARKLYEESIDLSRRLGDDRMLAVEQANLSWVEINEGRLDEAEALLQASLEAAGDEPYLRAFDWIGLARVAALRGDGARARELIADADRLLAEAGVVLDPADEPEYRRTVELAGDE
jgi:tetratricopeptide (TPR) repeat protein